MAKEKEQQLEEENCELKESVQSLNLLAKDQMEVCVFVCAR